jgi:hypothetical protein
MKTELITSLVNVILHYHEYEKHDLIQTCIEQGHDDVDELTSQELYDFCQKEEIDHIWLHIWQLGELHQNMQRVLH